MSLLRCSHFYVLLISDGRWTSQFCLDELCAEDCCMDLGEERRVLSFRQKFEEPSAAGAAQTW
jgi:hypothetical protein